LRDGTVDDRDAYFALAGNLAATGKYVDNEGAYTAYRPVLYPLVLAGLIRAWPDNAYAVYLLNALLGCASALLVYAIAKRIMSRGAALVAAGFVAVEPYIVLTSTEVMSESLFIFLMLLMIRFLVARSQKELRTPLAGIVFALLVLCRPEGVIFIIPAGVAFFSLCRTWKKRMRAVLFFLCGFLAIYSIWIYRNYERFGAFVPFTTHGGYTLYLGNNESFYQAERSGLFWEKADFDAWTEENRRQTRGMNELERNSYFYKKAGDFIRADIGRFARLLWLKCRRFWRLHPHGVSLSVEAVSSLYMILLYVFSLAGAVYLFKMRRQFLVLILPVILMCLVHMIYWSQIRFRVPLHPVLIILSMCVIFREHLAGDASESGNQESEER